MKKNLIPFGLFLLILIFISPVTKSMAAAKHQFVIIDLPSLDLAKLTTDYPNLYRLVSKATTGLVKLPGSHHHQYASFSRHIANSALPRNTILTTASAKLISPNQPTPVICINAERYIDLEVFKNEKPGNHSVPNAGEKGLDRILKSYRLAYKKASIVVLAFRRMEQYPDEYNKPKVWRFYDDLIARILGVTNFKTTLLLLYPSQPRKENRNRNTAALTPIIIKGHDFTQGILYSPSTRKKGIVTFNDLRHNIREFMNPNAKRVLQIKPVSGEWNSIVKSQHSLFKNYSIRWPLLTGYAYLLIGVIVSFITGLICKFHQKLRLLIFWVYLFLLTAPAVFLLEAIIDPIDWLSVTIYTLIISGVLLGLSAWIAKKTHSRVLSWISVLTMGIVIIDGLLNGYYEYKSFLGYSVVAGARYYGIGNEYMGILLGSYIVATSLFLPKITQWRREILFLAMLVISVILIHPCFGADVGGGIAALIGLGITNYLWLGRKIRTREIVQLLLLMVIILAFAGTWDIYGNHNSMSHFGQLILAVQNHGFQVFINLASRKMALNIDLIRSTPLTFALIIILVAIPILYRYPPSSIKRTTDKHPEISAGLAGLAITALIGLLANDSGIISAAMTFMFGLGLIIAVTVNEQTGVNW
jgi:hypothetical protein